MLPKIDLRNAHIALVVLAVILFAGGYLVRNAGEGAMQLVGVAAFAASFGTFFFLHAREEQRRRREKPDQ